MQKLENLIPFDGEIFYFPKFLTNLEADKFFSILIKKIQWQQPEIKLFGKTYKVPRLTAWYGDENASYIYSGIKNQPLNWFNELLEIKNKTEMFCNHEWNSVLVNWYRNGNDSMGWHADDEKELGTNPVIASVSLGAKRKFLIKHKKQSSIPISLELENGSLLLMQGDFQHNWVHAIPKQKGIREGRINLTFRKIKL